MANTITKQILFDAGRNVIILAYIASDGAAGELSNEVLVDVSSLSPVPSTVVIDRIWASFSGFSGILEWDATTDIPFFAIPDGSSLEQDFKSFGGLVNNAGTGITGDITLTTTGFTASGDAGHIIFHVRKS